MSMKGNRRLRVRDESEDEEESSGAAVAAAMHKQKKKKKDKAAKAKGVGLSFGDDEEGDGPTFKVKKSKASRAFARKGVGVATDLLKTSAEETVTYASSSAGRYDADALKDLMASQTYSLPAPASDSAGAEGDGSAMDVVVPGDSLEEPQGQGGALPQLGRMGSMGGLGDLNLVDDMEDDLSGPLTGSLDRGPADLRTMKSREARRHNPLLDAQAGAEDDEDGFIPMERGGGRGGRGATTKLGSNPNSASAQRSTLKSTLRTQLAKSVAAGNDEAELLSWEAEAARRGAGAASLAGHTSDVMRGMAAAAERGSLVDSDGIGAGVAGMGGGGGGAAGLDGGAGGSFVTVSEIRRNIRRVTEEAQEMQDHNERQLEVAVRDQQECAESLEKIKTEAEGAGVQFMYFQEAREYFADLVGCAREKAQQVEEVRDVLISGVIDAARTRDQRRRETQNDALRELIGAAGDKTSARAAASAEEEAEERPRMGLGMGGMGLGYGSGAGLGLGFGQTPGLGLGMGGSSDTSGSNGTGKDNNAFGPFESLGPFTLAPDDDDDDDAGGGAPDDGDEFGRDRSYYKSRERTRRKEDRARRRLRAWRKRGRDQEYPEGVPQRVSGPQDILSESEDSDGDVAAQRTRRSKLLAAADLIFEDVEPEYCSLHRIKAAFQAWRSRYPAEYEAAFVSEALPKLLALFVEHQLISWTPLSNGVGVEDSTEEVGGSSMKMEVDTGAEDNGRSAGAETEEALVDLPFVADLADYGLAQEPAANGGAAAHPTQSVAHAQDARLVPALVELVVVPVVKQLLEEAYDPLSWAQTQRFTAVLRDVLDFDQKAEVKAQLLTAPLRRMKATVADLCVPLVKAPTEDATTTTMAASGPILNASESAALDFMWRQTYNAIKALRHFSCWAPLFTQGAPASPDPTSSLPHLILQSLLTERITPALLRLLRLDSPEKVLVALEHVSTALGPALTMLSQTSDWHQAAGRLRPLLLALDHKATGDAAAAARVLELQRRLLVSQPPASRSRY